MVRFDGKKDPSRRLALESPEGPRGSWVLAGTADALTLDIGFRPYRKTTLTYAVRIDEPFEVDTLEGLHTGNAGDWLAVGPHGEMYPIDAAVFADSYEPAEQEESR